MKYPKFKNDRKAFKQVRKFCKYLRGTLYLAGIPFIITGSTTSPSRYFNFISMSHKDLCIRVSNHTSVNPYYKNENTYNVIVQNIQDQTYIDNEVNNIKNWLTKKQIKDVFFYN